MNHLGILTREQCSFVNRVNNPYWSETLRHCLGKLQDKEERVKFYRHNLLLVIKLDNKYWPLIVRTVGGQI